jgi:hypothetical protein
MRWICHMAPATASQRHYRNASASQAAVLVRQLRGGLETALEQLVGGGRSRGSAASLGGSSLVDTAARILEAEEAALQRDRA